MCGLCTLFCSGSTVRVHPSLYIFVCCYVHTDRDSRMQRLKTLTILHIEELNRQRMHQPQNIFSWMSYQCTVSVCECAVRKVRLHSNLTYMHMWFTYHPTPLCTHQCHFIKAPSYPPGHGVIHDIWEVHSPI